MFKQVVFGFNIRSIEKPKQNFWNTLFWVQIFTHKITHTHISTYYTFKKYKKKKNNWNT